MTAIKKFREFVRLHGVIARQLGRLHESLNSAMATAVLVHGKFARFR
jgi:hypothetical protein